MSRCYDCANGIHGNCHEWDEPCLCVDCKRTAIGTVSDRRPGA